MKRRMFPFALLLALLAACSDQQLRQASTVATQTATQMRCAQYADALTALYARRLTLSSAQSQLIYASLPAAERVCEGKGNPLPGDPELISTVIALR